MRDMLFSLLVLVVVLPACSTQTPNIPINYESSVPGGTITRGGTPFALLGEPLAIGDRLPEVVLYDNNLKSVDLSKRGGEVLVVSVVPSIDTGVCEQQTHLLAEKEHLPAGIARVTISRDLPFAQKRFRDDAGFGDVLFLSDFKDGSFGRQTGLLIDEVGLLARAVLVLDRNGVVRYIQVVPEIGNLPDMERAFRFAEQLLREG